MSVQLILYPQSFNGLNSLSGLGTEQVVDGINFNTINTSASSLSLAAPTYQSAIDALNATMIVNTWYRFAPSITPPTETSGDVAFVNTQGILQKLSNLVVGQLYNVEIEASFPNLNFFVYSGTVQQSSTPVTTAGTNSFQFTATSTTNTIVIYSSSISIMSSVSIRQAAQNPSGAINNLSAGQVICDLYEDEDIPLTLSVDDFKNVAEQVQSYSKAFNLPATKRNNQIFDNIFEVTRDTSGLAFNPYVRTQCQLKQDGFILFQGYLRLIDIQEKQGETSYNVNLYSEAIALADLLENRTFSELDFSELTHDYNYTEIRNSWQGTLGLINPLPVGTFAGTAGASTTDVLRYPFVDWNHSFSYDPSTGFPVLPNLEAAFRPFISIKYLIQNIFAATPFSYTSDFIDNYPDFQKLYMDFNWGSNEFGTEVTGGTYSGSIGSLPAVPSSATFQSVALASNTFDSAMGWDNANNRFVAVNDNTTYDLNAVMYMGNTGGTTTLTTRFARYDSGGSFIQEYDLQAANANNGIGSPPRFSQTEAIIDTGDYLQFEWKTTVASDGYLSASAGAWIYGVTGSLTATTNTILQTLRGELGQWDFLKGIMTMFNLISVPDKTNPNNILIEPYNDIFLENSDSTQLDWTDKIDVEEIKLTPLTELNKKTIFKFVEDDDDYAFSVYKNSAQGHLYGSRVFDASTSSNNLPTILTGEKEVIAEPFAATVPKPLDNLFSDFIVPSIYSYNADDGTSEGFDNSPRIMYNNGVETLTTCTYFVPCQNQPTPCGDATEDEFLQFSHLTDIPTTASTTDFHFGICQLIQPIGNPTTNNLFNTYWLPYFNELYNPDTRTMTLKVNLTPGDINTFKFYDIVFIKNREFRVNKIDYKPNDLATVEFILIP